MNDNNVSNNSHTSIQSESNHKTNIITGNRYNNLTKSVPTSYFDENNNYDKINIKSSIDDNSNNNTNNYSTESATLIDLEIKNNNQKYFTKNVPTCQKQKKR